MRSLRKIAWVLFVGLCFIVSAEAKVIKIGVLVPKTGIFATSGFAMENAAKLALKHAHPDKYEYELVFADSGFTPQQAKSAFLDLVNKGVVAIVGAYSSPQAIACAKAAYETKTVYMIPVASTGRIKGMVKNGNKYVFRNAYDTSYWGTLAAKFLDIAGVDTFYFVGFDPLRTFNQLMLKEILKKTSVKLKDKVFYVSPRVNPKDAVTKARIMASKLGKRDVIILGDPGRSSITFVKSYRGFGGKGVVYSVGGVLGLPFILKKLKVNKIAFQAAALEHTPKTTYTLRYFKDYKKYYGEEANTYAGVMTYDAVLIIVRAIEKGGVDNLIKTLEKGKFTGAAGVYSFDSYHQARWGTEKLKGVIAEYVNGKIHILYPEQFAESGVVW